jgi:hypothetical protein
MGECKIRLAVTYRRCCPFHDHHHHDHHDHFDHLQPTPSRHPPSPHRIQAPPDFPYNNRNQNQSYQNQSYQHQLNHLSP